METKDESLFEELLVIRTVPYRTFKEKMRITKEYDRIASRMIVEDGYVVLVIKEKVVA